MNNKQVTTQKGFPTQEQGEPYKPVLMAEALIFHLQKDICQFITHSLSLVKP